MENKCCPGCGAVFQREDENLPGYLVPGKEPDGKVLCKRCFQLKHYGVFKKALISDPEIIKKLTARAKQASAIFLVVDVTRPEISMHDLDWAGRFHKPVFILANKVDLLTPWLTRKEVMNRLVDLIGVRREQVLLLSGQNSHDMRELRNRIADTFEEDESVIFAGSANVGKSTILSAVLENDKPTVSRLPGTTVGITEYKMTDGPFLVDAPGLKGEDPFVARLCPDCLANLSPKKTFKSSLEVVRTGQTVMFGGLAQITVEDAGRRGWVRFGIFAPDNVVVHQSRADRIDALLKDHSGEMLVPPCKKCAKRLLGDKWTEQTFALYPEEDLVIPGIGWIALYRDRKSVV